MQKDTFLGLDVHAESISVAIAEPGRSGAVRSLGTIPNEPAAIEKLVRKLSKGVEPHVCYEAGPTGYGLYWQLTKLGIDCTVVAPTLIPQKSGDRVKTDRRDAEKLAKLHRAGELTAVWVPDEAHEALRDLVRAREAAVKDKTRARNRLGKLLLRQGRRRPEHMTAWGTKHLVWLRAQKWEHAAHQVVFDDALAQTEHHRVRVKILDQAIEDAIAKAPAHTQAMVAGLQALRGVALVTAATIATEIGQVSRFDMARQLMAYVGLVPSENSTGGPGKARRGGITKTGNAHVRRVIVESAWHARHVPGTPKKLLARQAATSESVRQIAWKAQQRLHGKYRRLLGKGKAAPQVVVAVARELVGFVWTIAREIEKEHPYQANA